MAKRNLIALTTVVAALGACVGPEEDAEFRSAGSTGWGDETAGASSTGEGESSGDESGSGSESGGAPLFHALDSEGGFPGPFHAGCIELYQNAACAAPAWPAPIVDYCTSPTGLYDTHLTGATCLPWNGAQSTWFDCDAECAALPTFTGGRCQYHTITCAGAQLQSAECDCY